MWAREKVPEAGDDVDYKTQRHERRQHVHGQHAASWHTQPSPSTSSRRAILTQIRQLN